MNLRTAPVLAIARMVLGLLMVLLFFLPLFSSPLMDLNGPDTVEFVREAPREKIRIFDRLTGILMLVVPIGSVFLGFLSAGFGGLGLQKVAPKGELVLSILCGVNLVAGFILVVKMTSVDKNFFNAFLPQPSMFFYLLLGLHFLQITAYIIYRLLEHNQVPSAAPDQMEP